MVQFSNGHNDQGWVRLKLGARNLYLISFVSAGTKYLGHPLLSQVAVQGVGSEMGQLDFKPVSV